MKNCHVDKFGSNDDLDTFICEDINGTFTACGGDVRKNSGISPTTTLPLLYYISRMLRYQKKRKDCGFFFFNLELCFKLCLFSRDIFWS